MKTKKQKNENLKSNLSRKTYRPRLIGECSVIVWFSDVVTPPPYTHTHTHTHTHKQTEQAMESQGEREK